jgi:hypothetical protein
VDLVTNPVTRATVDYPVALGDTLQIAVVITIFKPHLEGVMVNIAHG